MNKQQKKLQKELEAQKVEENKHQDELTEDAKELEKISTKTASLVKKVSKLRNDPTTGVMAYTPKK